MGGWILDLNGNTQTQRESVFTYSLHKPILTWVLRPLTSHFDSIKAKTFTLQIRFRFIESAHFWRCISLFDLHTMGSFKYPRKRAEGTNRESTFQSNTAYSATHRLVRLTAVNEDKKKFFEMQFLLVRKRDITTRRGDQLRSNQLHSHDLGVRHVIEIHFNGFCLCFTFCFIHLLEAKYQ